MQDNLNKEKLNKILSILETYYPNVKSSLNFTNPFECWIAVVLSAQCTDKKVNIVTKSLFEKYKTYEDLSSVDINILRSDIGSISFPNVKSKYLQKGAQIIIDKFNNNLPDNIDDLLILPGVGRKVANVINAEINGKFDGIAIDTHNKRVLPRIGLTTSKDTSIIEKDIIEIAEVNNFQKISLLFIELGREYCKPKKPNCQKCPINKYCKYYSDNLIYNSIQNRN